MRKGPVGLCNGFSRSRKEPVVLRQGPIRFVPMDEHPHTAVQSQRQERETRQQEEYERSENESREDGRNDVRHHFHARSSPGTRSPLKLPVQVRRNLFDLSAKKQAFVDDLRTDFHPNRPEIQHPDKWAVIDAHHSGERGQAASRHTGQEAVCPCTHHVTQPRDVTHSPAFGVG